jgi:hypothetical protein
MTFAALAHGAFNGMMSGVQGGNFWTGFAAGALSSLAAGLWQGGAMADGADGAKRAWSGLGGTWGGGDFGTIAFGTVSGGAGAALTGGNFWQGAVTGLMVSGLNDVMHKENKMDSEDDEQTQKGKRVTKESLGIKKGDDRETMIDKTLKGMKVNDYITGDDASFLGEDAKTYIKTITRTGSNSFSIDGDSNWVGVSAFKIGATMNISHLKTSVSLKSGAKLSYKITINGITTAGSVFNVYTVYYIGRNTSYTHFGDGYHKIPN